MNDLKGGTALVTGDGRGLGAALAVSMADQGCDVILAGRQDQRQRQRSSGCGDAFVVLLAGSGSVGNSLQLNKCRRNPAAI